MNKEKYESALKRTNLIWVLADIQETLITELEQDPIRLEVYEFDVKMKIKQLKKMTEAFRTYFNRTMEKRDSDYKLEKQLNFGEDGDELRELIYKAVEL